MGRPVHHGMVDYRHGIHIFCVRRALALGEGMTTTAKKKPAPKRKTCQIRSCKKPAGGSEGMFCKFHRDNPVSTAKTARKKKPKRKKGPTLRERKLWKYLAEGLPIQEAGLKAGYSKSFCSSELYSKLRKPENEGKFTDALEKAGVTDEKIAQTIKNGLDADKVISANVIAPGGEGMADAHGMTKDFVYVEDHPTRLKAADMGLRLKDHYPAKKIDVSVHERALEELEND